jgi:hypothetical protein
MTKPIVTNGDYKKPHKDHVYEEFINWSAMIPTERANLGIENQEQFVEFYKIGINTPAHWKKRPDFKSRVKDLRNEWAFGKTSAVFEGIFRSALKGNPQSQKLFLQLSDNLPNKDNKWKEATIPIISPKDVRWVINLLPDPLKIKYLNFVDELMYATKAVQNGQDHVLEELSGLYTEEQKWLEQKRIDEDPEFTGKYL